MSDYFKAQYKLWEVLCISQCQPVDASLAEILARHAEVSQVRVSQALDEIFLYASSCGYDHIHLRQSSKQSNWLIILLVTDLWKLYKCVPFCALPGSGCSLWLRSWWGWRCNPERWCSPTWIHQTCHTHFLHLAPLAQDASLSVGAETLDDSLNLYHLKGLVHPITNLRDKWI